MSYLPHAPNDNTKYIYLKRNIFWYSIFALMCTISSLIGLVNWTIQDILRYPFFGFIIIYILFMGFTFMIGIVGKDFNFKKHIKILNDHNWNSFDAPSVDIFLPCAGEAIEVIKNTYEHVSQIQWQGKLIVHILDDSNNPEIEKLSNYYNFNYIVRTDRPHLKKAGNLRYAFARTKGEYFVVFDADFCPRTDFLTEMMPYFKYDPKIGIMQSPQHFDLPPNSNYIEKGSTSKQELFYRAIQVSRNNWGGAVCVGTNAIYSRQALIPFGGTAPMGHSEDMHTGFQMVMSGYKIMYIPVILASGLAPDNLYTYFTQQYRWALGNLILITSKKFWFSSVKPLLKFNYIASILYYVYVSLGIILNTLPILIVLIFNPETIQLFNLIFAFPFLIFIFIIHPIWQQNEWDLSCISANIAANVSYLFALVDLLRGKSMEWVPTGQSQSKQKNGQNKKMNFYYYQAFIIIWYYLVFALIVILCYKSMSSVFDYRFYPILFFFFLNTYIVVNIFRETYNLPRLGVTKKLLNQHFQTSLLKRAQIMPVILYLFFFCTLTFISYLCNLYL
jgi:cellulose synthase/poly-beta-1,6-N-acetylglucosamine synthase-like glycosyltransferase